MNAKPRNRILAALEKACWRSRHNGTVKTLTDNVLFTDLTYWPKEWKVRICGVSVFGVRVQALGRGRMATATIAHSNINW